MATPPKTKPISILRPPGTMDAFAKDTELFTDAKIPTGMREFMRIVESFDWSRLSSDELAKIAHAEGDNATDKIKASDCDWHYDPALPLTRLESLMSVQDWKTWMADEIEMEAEDDLRRGWVDLPNENIHTPIVVMFARDGSVELWDGWHRTASQIVRGADTIPAIVGVERPMKSLIESQQESQLSEALWWVVRWISGSIDDPDWDWGEPTTLSLIEAMRIVGQKVGNSHSVGKPLHRYFHTDVEQFAEMERTHLLSRSPHTRGFQSFTTVKEDMAVENGQDIHWPDNETVIEALVTIQPDPAMVLFGIRDMRASRDSHVLDACMQVRDWWHQEEVFVDDTRPIKITAVRIIE